MLTQCACSPKTTTAPCVLTIPIEAVRRRNTIYPKAEKGTEEKQKGRKI